MVRLSFILLLICIKCINGQFQLLTGWSGYRFYTRFCQPNPVYDHWACPQLVRIDLPCHRPCIEDRLPLPNIVKLILRPRETHGDGDIVNPSMDTQTAEALHQHVKNIEEPIVTTAELNTNSDITTFTETMRTVPTTYNSTEQIIAPTAELTAKAETLNSSNQEHTSTYQSPVSDKLPVNKSKEDTISEIMSVSNEEPEVQVHIDKLIVIPGSRKRVNGMQYDYRNHLDTKKSPDQTSRVNIVIHYHNTGNRNYENIELEKSSADATGGMSSNAGNNDKNSSSINPNGT